MFKADELFCEFTTKKFQDEMKISKNSNEQCVTFVANNTSQVCDQPGQDPAQSYGFNVTNNKLFPPSFVVQKI
ncbi:11326_t:CDS:2 [Funneliformis mosseae]|uniref:11326_t:CDS:1 n=1 Tax=Funneliformis mosseae TaxID=27381 RepID=A0A9N9ASV6_FUNMO|nr:11326_t:CDS:2 [Funneliformis mosseae]